MVKFYAVKIGWNSRIFLSWTECQKEILGFPGNRFKSFATRTEAEDFMSENQENYGDYARSDESTPNKRRKIPKINEAPHTTEQSAAITRLCMDYPGLSCVYEERDRVCVFTSGFSKMLPNYTCITGFGVFWADNCPLNSCQKHTGIQKAYNAAIYAVITAVETAHKHGIKMLKINTDDEYIVNCMTKWIKNWKRNGWKVKDGTNVKYKEDLERLDDFILESRIYVSWAVEERSRSILEVRKLAEEGALQHLIRKNINNNYDISRKNRNTHKGNKNTLKRRNIIKKIL